MLELSAVDRLLDPRPMPLEVGFERLANGVLHVACRTDMYGCTGEMFEWWFRSRPDTRHYVWWHPIDHVTSEWVEGSPHSHIGSIHLVEERLSDIPAQSVAVQFRPNEEFFDTDRFLDARTRGAISSSVCGRVGVGHEPDRDADGGVLGGRLLHIGRDTEWGLVLRSHFYLGQDLPDLGLGPTDVDAIFPDAFGQSLLMHCYNEFVYLSRFLPSLYIGDNRGRLDLQAPW